MLLDRLTAVVFRGLSAARGARMFHPQGVAFHARWEPDARDGERTTPLSTPSGGGRELDAVVRLSRAVGLPQGTPDVLGLAIKLLDAHGPGRDQDLALASSGRSVVARHLLVPRRDFSATVFSSVLPYAVSGERVTVLAEMIGDTPPRSFADLADEGHAPADVRISLTPPGRALGVLRMGERLSDDVSRDLRFDPWHTGPGLRPIGWLNRLRRPTYAASQEGRDAPAAGARPALPDELRREPTR